MAPRNFFRCMVNGEMLAGYFFFSGRILMVQKIINVNVHSTLNFWFFWKETSCDSSLPLPSEAGKKHHKELIASGSRSEKVWGKSLTSGAMNRANSRFPQKGSSPRKQWCFLFLFVFVDVYAMFFLVRKISTAYFSYGALITTSHKKDIPKHRQKLKVVLDFF